MSSQEIKKFYGSCYVEQFKVNWEIKRIASQVLSQAVSDLLGGEDGYRENRTHKKTTSQKEAFSWFESNSTEWIFSFINVCDLLDLHPDWVRKQIVIGKVYSVRRSNRMGKKRQRK